MSNRIFLIFISCAEIYLRLLLLIGIFIVVDLNFVNSPSKKMPLYLDHFNGYRWQSFADITLREMFVKVSCAVFLVMFIIAIVKIGLKINERLERSNRIEPKDCRFADNLVVEQVTCSTYFIPINWDNNCSKDFFNKFATRYL